jgi:hypothetical protein
MLVGGNAKPEKVEKTVSTDGSKEAAASTPAVVEPKVNQTTKAIEAAIAAGKIQTAPELKAIAIALGIAPVRIYGVAKQPIEGMVYDKNVFNWDAIDRFITKRLDPDKFPTHDAVIAAAIASQEELKAQDGRHRTSDPSAKLIALPGGKYMPKRKDTFEISQVVLRKEEPAGIEYTIVFLTDTHMVLQLNGSSELICLSNWTVNYQIIPPFRTEEERAKRKAVATAAANASAESAKA